MERIKKAVEVLIRPECPDCRGTKGYLVTDPVSGFLKKIPCPVCDSAGFIPLLSPGTAKKLRRAAELLACFLGSLVVYYFLGWQETTLEQCVVVLLLIMIDMAILRQRMEGK